MVFTATGFSKSWLGSKLRVGKVDVAVGFQGYGWQVYIGTAVEALTNMQ
jgi:hypothetical protein